MSAAFNPDDAIPEQPIIAHATNGHVLHKKKTRKIYRRTARGAIKTTIATVNEDEEAAPPIPFEEVNFRPSRGFRPEEDDRSEFGSVDGSSLASSRYSIVSELTQSVAPSMVGGTPRPDFERIPSQIGMKSFSSLGEQEMSPRKSITSTSQLDDSGRSGYSYEAASPLMMGGASSRSLSMKNIGRDSRRSGRVSPLTMTIGPDHGALSSPLKAPDTLHDDVLASPGSQASPSRVPAATKRGSLPRVQEEIISPSNSMDLPQTNSGLFLEVGGEIPVTNAASSFDELDEAEQQRRVQSRKVAELQKQNRFLCILLILVVAGGVAAITLVLIFLL